MLAALNFMTLILSRLIRQMLANFFEVDSKGLYQSTGEEKESCCLVFPSSTKREIRHFHVEVVKRRERNVQKAWCTCKVVVLLIKPIVFSLFSLPSPSLDLKLPNGSLFLSPKPVPGVRMVQKKREKKNMQENSPQRPPPHHSPTRCSFFLPTSLWAVPTVWTPGTGYFSVGEGRERTVGTRMNNTSLNWGAKLLSDAWKY